MHRLAPMFWATFAGLSSAQIDSGGGKSAVGGITHHASLGSSFATGNDFLAVDKNKSGLQAQKLH